MSFFLVRWKKGERIKVFLLLLYKQKNEHCLFFLKFCGDTLNVAKQKQENYYILVLLTRINQELSSEGI